MEEDDEEADTQYGENGRPTRKAQKKKSARKEEDSEEDYHMEGLEEDSLEIQPDNDDSEFEGEAKKRKKGAKK